MMRPFVFEKNISSLMMGHLNKAALDYYILVGEHCVGIYALELHKSYHACVLAGSRLMITGYWHLFLSHWSNCTDINRAS